MEHWELVNDGSIMVHNTAEQLWLKATEYFEWCDANPIQSPKMVMSGKEAGKVINMQLRRPYTIKGLCLHCGIDEEYLMEIRRLKDKDSLYVKVVSRIAYVVHVQNVEGAMVGDFNAQLVMKVLSLDKGDDTAPKAIQVHHTTTELPALAKSENEILENLDRELMEKIKKDSENSKEQSAEN
jgi:predicted nucleic-acid-binding Zn-ribbon protein